MMTEEQEHYKKLLKEIQRQNFELYQIERKKILGDKSYQSQEENYINQLRQSDLINRIESYVEDKVYKCIGKNDRSCRLLLWYQFITGTKRSIGSKVIDSNQTTFSRNEWSR